VDTLRCSFAQGFDSVVVHYYLPPPTCQDYGTIFLADNMIVTPYNVTNISEGKIPEFYALSQNYPNPFNPTTKIDFAIRNNGFVSLKIFDILGREVRQLVNETKNAGVYSVEFNAAEFASGVYLYKLESNGFVDVKKMMLIK
jgi:hypothetical protein